MQSQIKNTASGIIFIAMPLAGFPFFKFYFCVSRSKLAWIHEMRIQGKEFQTIWTQKRGTGPVYIIDQTRLPSEFRVQKLQSCRDAFRSIRNMQVRGAPLIGVAAAYGIALAFRETAFRRDWRNLLESRFAMLEASRPTAVNLTRALQILRPLLQCCENVEAAEITAWKYARDLRESEIAACSAIGDHGLPLIETIAASKKGEPVNILTHCNAGWLACVDWGTALAPVYKAWRKGIPLHVWVDETRPRLQGARLTAYELQEEGIAHTLITDNAGGHLMQSGKVDLLLTGSDRTSRCGDVCNKIGTYLKGLAARENGIPFYVALPLSSIDLQIRNASEIPIEERSQEEVLFIESKRRKLRIATPGTPAANPGFDITPAQLVSGLITERGICPATEAGIRAIMEDPDHAA
jgi:methylthioribose-1-phosphate isomerase